MDAVRRCVRLGTTPRTPPLTVIGSADIMQPPSEYDDMPEEDVPTPVPRSGIVVVTIVTTSVAAAALAA